MLKPNAPYVRCPRLGNCGRNVVESDHVLRHCCWNWSPMIVVHSVYVGPLFGEDHQPGTRGRIPPGTE